MADNVEAEVIKQSIPDLVLAVTDNVTAVSDECLAKGLIAESTSRRTLDPSAGTREERARSLVHSVHGSIKTDSCCFEIFLEVLSNTLPERVKEKVVADLRKELADQTSTKVCKAVIPVSESRRPVLLENSLQCLQEQSSFLEKYESSVSRHASASTKKSLFEETLQSKIDEISGLKTNLDMLCHSDDTSSKDKEIQSTKNRLSACETEVSNLRGRIEEMECIIEEESMRARRGRSTIRVETKRLFEEFARQSQDNFDSTLKTALHNKERQHKRILTEKEAEIRWQLQEEIRRNKHKVELQQKELQIKELQLNKARMELEKSSTNSNFPTAFNLSRREAEIRRRIQKEVNSKVKDLEHKVELQQKELKIKELELTQNAELKHENRTKSKSTTDLLHNKAVPHQPWQQVSLPRPAAATTLTKLSSHHLAKLLQQLIQHATKWKDIGFKLGFTDGELTTIQESPSLLHDAPSSLLREILSQWLEWAPGDGRGSVDFATLEELKRALRQANLGRIAHDLHI